MLTLTAATGAVAAAVGAWAAAGKALQEDDDEAIEQLMLAAKDGRLESLAAAVEQRGVHVDARRDADGDTALHVCAETGQSDAIRMLLSLGADPRAASGRGRMLPLHAAAAAGHLMPLKLLLVRDPSSAAVGDANGHLPLHWAAAGAHVELLQHLLGAGSKGNIHETRFRGGVQVDARTSDSRRTALMLAAAACARDERAVECVELLLKHHADVAATDAHGESALHLACAAGGGARAASSHAFEQTLSAQSDDGAVRVVRLLCDAGAPIFGVSSRGTAPVDLCAPDGPLRAALDQFVARRLRQGQQEANAANIARAHLVQRLRRLALSQPVLLEQVCEDADTKALLNRFAVRAPPLGPALAGGAPRSADVIGEPS